MLLLSNFINHPYALLIITALLNIGSIILIDKYNHSSMMVDEGLETLNAIRHSSNLESSRSNTTYQISMINAVIKDTSKMIISFSAIRLITIISFIGSVLLAVVPIVSTIITPW
jgi:hypothetical protein